MPNLDALTRAGRRHELETPAADFAAGAFYSLYSGVELGDHGIFYPFQWSAAEQRARYATAFEAPPAVWERLAESGLRTLAIDPYESRPPARAEGVFVCGWGFADRVVLPRWSRPEGAAREYARRHGRGPGATEIFGRPRVRDLLALRETLVAAPRRIAELAEELLARESFDLAWLTFSAAHLAGHQFWDLSQLDAAALDPGRRATLEAALDDVYTAVDDALGRVLAALPPGADVIVTSAVGMDVNTSRADLLPAMLARVLAGGPLDDGDAGAIWRLRAALPGPVRARIAAAIPDRAALELTARLELRGIDWAAARAFAHPADNQGYVRLNLRERERDGIVDGGDAGALEDEIATGLATFTDPDGAPAVDAVVRAASCIRAGTPTGSPTWWSAGPTAPPPSSPPCARRASARSGARGAARAAPVTTRPAMPGRWWCPGPRGMPPTTAGRRGSWTWRRPCARSLAPTPVDCPGGRC